MVSKLLNLGRRLTLSLLLLSTGINGCFDALESKLNTMAKRGEKIDDLFVPSKNGTIKHGGFGLVFKGMINFELDCEKFFLFYTQIEDGQSVALKFVKMEDRNLSDHEFRIYGYLNAINQTNVNKFGIPTLYYYNEWNGYMLTVLSFFDGGDLEDLSFGGHFNHKNASLAINSFLLFRDFVIQSKYMHSCGVRHDDIKPGNIVVQGRKSYLIDFNSASKMNEEKWSGTMKFFPRRLYNAERPTAKSDWESFLYTMAYINRIELGWFWTNLFPDSAIGEAQADPWIGYFMKNDMQYIMSKIDGAPIASPALKRVFQRFASEALYSQNLNPSYDSMLRFIESEMGGRFESVNGKYKVFTWLQGYARKTASRESVDDEIRKICVPENFEAFNYKEYRLNYFPKPISKER